MGAATNGTGDGTLKEQIRGVTADITRHQSNIDELYAKYEGVGRTNWQIVLSAIAVLVVVVGGLWGLTASPIGADIKDLSKKTTTHEATLTQHAAELAVLKAKVESIQDTQRVFRELMRRVEDERLPTREFVIHQTANTNSNAVVQRQIDDLNKKIDAVFPPNKVLEDLVRRLAELERTRTLPAAGAAR